MYHGIRLLEHTSVEMKLCLLLMQLPDEIVQRDQPCCIHRRYFCTFSRRWFVIGGVMKCIICGTTLNISTSSDMVWQHNVSGVWIYCIVITITLEKDPLFGPYL